jgi:hypothetical protein
MLLKRTPEYGLLILIILLATLYFHYRPLTIWGTYTQKLQTNQWYHNGGDYN